ncbi:response regulator [Kaarinaea lacus]
MSKMTALIAEDVEIMSRLLKSNLRTYDCEVIVEEKDGANVIMQIENSKPDMVFLDINLPNKSGLDILAEIKSKHPQLFVVMTSAEATMENIRKSLELGASGFLSKPFSGVKIKEIMGNYKSNLTAIPKVG